MTTSVWITIAGVLLALRMVAGAVVCARRGPWAFRMRCATERCAGSVRRRPYHAIRAVSPDEDVLLCRLCGGIMWQAWVAPARRVYSWPLGSIRPIPSYEYNMDAARPLPRVDGDAPPPHAPSPPTLRAVE